MFCVCPKSCDTNYHTFTRQIIYLRFLISPGANETHHSLSSCCLISITFSPPLTSASQTPMTPTSHLPPPTFSPLLYYPAGIALGTLQSSAPTPVTPSDRQGKKEGQWSLFLRLRTFGGFALDITNKTLISLIANY